MSGMKRVRPEPNLLLDLSIDVTGYLMRFLETPDVLACRRVSKALVSKIGPRWPIYLTLRIKLGESMLLIPMAIRTGIENAILVCENNDENNLYFATCFALAYPRVRKVHVEMRNVSLTLGTRILRELPDFSTFAFGNEDKDCQARCHLEQNRTNAKAILSALYLYTYSGESLDFLAPLTGLTELDVPRYAGPSIADLRGLTNLTALNLDSYNGPELDALGYLTNLVSLSLRSYTHPNLTPLNNLTRLRDLSIYPCNNRFNWGTLTGLSGLASVQVVRGPDPEDEIDQLLRLCPNAHITWTGTYQIKK